jgi:hypothetical protein
MFMAIMNQMNPYEPPESDHQSKRLSNRESFWVRTTPLQKTLICFGVVKLAEWILQFITWLKS